MAAALKETELAQLVYAALKDASCPLLEGLYLQEADSMLQLLCVSSQHRTNILSWICSRIKPNFAISKSMSMRSKDSDGLTKEIALLGQELLLCKAGDLDLIRGNATPYHQLQFLEQLLTLVPGCKTSAGHQRNEEKLLNELFTAKNLPQLRQMLEPSLDPWPAHLEALLKGTLPSQSREEDADLTALLQATQCALDQLQSGSEFLNHEGQSPGTFSPSSLRVAACDLQQLMATFSHVYETDLRAYCSRTPPSFSTESGVFQRIQQLLAACNTELEMIKEVSEASSSMSEEVNWLQTQPRYWRKGEKHTLPDEVEELTRRICEFTSLFQSCTRTPDQPNVDGQLI